MMRRFGRRMRGGEGVTPGGFPRSGGRRRRRGGLKERGRRLSQSQRVARIATRRGISTEQASELFKQRIERRQARRRQRMGRRAERVTERRGISREDAQKLIADRRARRQERRAARGNRGAAGNNVSRAERIAGRKKEFLSRIREKMGMDQGKRADFEERMKARRGRRASNNDMRRSSGSGNSYRGRFGRGKRRQMMQQD